MMKAIAWVVLRFLYRIRVYGRDNIPDQDAAILVPNHVSYIDAVLIASNIERPIRFAMYWKLFNRFRWIVEPLGAFPIASRLENPMVYANAIKTMQETIRRGDLLCIFPEGKITKTGELDTFQGGIMKVLTTTPAPVIPMGLCGIWGSYFSKARPGIFKLPDHFGAKIELLIGDPLAADTTLEQIQNEVRILSRQ